MIRQIGLWGALVLSLLLSGCGGSSGSSTPPPTAVISVGAPAETSFSIADGSVAVVLSAQQSTTEREASLSYQWQLIERPQKSSASLRSESAIDTEFTADIPGQYTISLIVNDGGADSEAVRMTFQATTPVPLAIADTQHSISLGTDSLGLDASRSSLPTGASGTLDYRWTLVAMPESSSAYLSNEDQNLATLHLDVEGTYQVALVVIHEGIESQAKLISVEVSSGDARPMAKADDVTVVLGQEVVLDASASVDPEGNPLQYRWNWASYKAVPSGAPVPQMTGRTESELRFSPRAVGDYKLELFVFDGKWNSAIKEVLVTVEKDPDSDENLAPIGEIQATGYYPSYSVGEQEVGLRAEFLFDGYDPEGEPLQILSATVTEKPDASEAELVNIGSWKPLGKKIQTLDAVGLYKVEFVISDGVNKIIKEAQLEAKIGNVNGYPSTRGVNAQANSVLVGDALVFDASSKDPNDDPMTFHWELVDKPDGSDATIEVVVEPESQEKRRAKVFTDLPGSYQVRLIVEDDRGLFATSYAYESGFAKLVNTAPEIRSVVWARSWSRMKPGEDYFQILPCMSLLHRPSVVDADGDEVATHEELIALPEGGGFTSYPDSADCPDSRGQVFSKPGQYVFRYYASDGIDDAENYDFVVNVDAIEDARGVRLRSLNDDNESLWQPLPYEYKPPFANDFETSVRPYTDEARIQWSLIAADGDYTIENVEVRHINGGLAEYTPRFEGLKEGTVIAQGQDLRFQTVFPPVTCLRNEEQSEGFHLSFRIKELPQITFVYEYWRTANMKSDYSEWTECAAE